MFNSAPTKACLIFRAASWGAPRQWSAPPAALVIADEVQAGYCRTGRWWGYEVTEFMPDIVVTGKPMGNGLPLAAASASKALVDGFRAKTGYFNTFASSPLQAAVGMAVIDVIEKHSLRENARVVGTALHEALLERKAHCAFIGDVRGQGLFLAIEIIKDRGGQNSGFGPSSRVLQST